jgi:Caspase domain
MGFRGTGTLGDLVTPWRVVGAFGFIGLFAYLLWGHPGNAVVTIVWAVSYAALIVKDLGVRLAFVTTAAIGVSVVPLLYALVLLIQLPLVVSGLTPFHAHVYFVRSLYGALAGAAIGFFAFKDRAESMAEEMVPKLARPGYRVRWGQLFDLSAPRSAAAIALVLLVPCLFVVPGTTGGVVVSGVLWGIMTGLVEVLIALRVEGRSVRQGWKRVAVVEMLTGILFVFEVGYYWIDRDQFRWYMAFLPAGAICYAATYGLIHLTTITMARLGVTWPAWKGDDEVPGRAAAAITAVATGQVLNRILGHLDRNSARTVRIRLPNGDEVALDDPAAESSIAGIPARARTETAARRALIVATGGYDDPALAGLRGPTRDADTLARVYGDPATGGFEVDLLIDGDGSTVRQRIAVFFAERGRDDLLMLHVSGHVVIDAGGRLHLAVRDTELAALDATGVPVSFIRDRFGSHRVVVILDCCSIEALAAGTPTPTDHVVPVGEAFGAGGRRTVLTASSTIEYTFAGTDLTRSRPQPSMFTAALATGLTTGEADLDGDGEITVDELYEYARERTRRHAPDQTPMMWGDGTVTVASAARAASRSTE